MPENEMNPIDLTTPVVPATDAADEATTEATEGETPAVAEGADTAAEQGVEADATDAQAPVEPKVEGETGELMAA